MAAQSLALRHGAVQCTILEMECIAFHPMDGNVQTGVRTYLRTYEKKNAAAGDQQHQSSFVEIQQNNNRKKWVSTKLAFEAIAR